MTNTILLAPNGKLSNLTPEQYKLVRGKEFKDWFGDWENNPQGASKVVDENGEPLVVYHGTQNDFKKNKDEVIFDTKYDGVHFGTIETTHDFFPTTTYPVFLCIKNLQNGLDQEVLARKIIEQVKKEYRTQFLTEKMLKEVQYKTPLYREQLKPNFDGIKYLNIIEGNKNSFSYVVFEPNQIKLADGTNTTFDSKNPDIRYMAGGIIKKPRKIAYNLQSEIDSVKNAIIHNADISFELKQKLREVRAYVVNSVRGWARYRRGFFSVPMFAYKLEKYTDEELKQKYRADWYEKHNLSKGAKGYFIYYVAHELAHWLCWFTNGIKDCDGHNRNFYDAFKKLCPRQYQYFELGYIKGSSQYGVPTYDQCVVIPAEEQTPTTEHCRTIESKQRLETQNLINLLRESLEFMDAKEKRLTQRLIADLDESLEYM